MNTSSKNKAARPTSRGFWQWLLGRGINADG